MKDKERYEIAQTHVRLQKKFWVHLALFVVVNAVLVTLNLVQSPEKLWVHWVLIGWGAGLVLNAFTAFGSGYAKNWEENKIREMVKHDAEKEAARTKSSTI